ncbi:MAG: hypothetical protein AB7S81_06280 [Bdellovibrionales bacterium]
MSILGCMNHRKAKNGDKPLSDKAMQVLFGAVPERKTRSQRKQPPKTDAETNLIKAVGETLGVDPKSAVVVTGNIWTLPACQTMKAAGVNVSNVQMIDEDTARVTARIANTPMSMRLTRTEPSPA